MANELSAAELLVLAAIDNESYSDREQAQQRAWDNRRIYVDDQTEVTLSEFERAFEELFQWEWEV